MSFKHVNWKRPTSTEYPRVWHNFQVKKIDSDEFEEYCIKDLPESRAEDAFEFMVENFCKDVTLSKAYDKFNKKDMIEFLKIIWKAITKQKTALVCFKKGSDEIVGIDMNYVVCKYDVRKDAFDFIEHTIFNVIDECRHLRLFLNSFYRCNVNEPAPLMTSKMCDIGNVSQSIAKNFDEFNEFKHYGVNKYLSSCGLAVAQNYRGRGIGVQLLKTGDIFCNEFGIKLILNIFTPKPSNECADKAGFKLERVHRYPQIFPEVQHVKMNAMTIKYVTTPLQNE